MSPFNIWRYPSRRQITILAGEFREFLLKVPLHGTVRELHDQLLGQLSYLASDSLVEQYMREIMDVVVYLEPMAHQGGGKVKINAAEALASHPDCYASQFIPATPSGRGQSLRYLRIGRRQFWLEYISADDWRSNVGDVRIRVLCEEKPKPDAELVKLDEPLVAVDFVRADGLYAVDYNIAPGLKGTGIEALLSPQEIYQEIKAWFCAQAVNGSDVTSA